MRAAPAVMRFPEALPCARVVIGWGRRWSSTTGICRPAPQGSFGLGDAGHRVWRTQSMASVTFQIIEGIDKGRTFRELPTPVTIGREEGNLLRLNDERVSRFHAKVQADNDEIILTDLESTNGTRVNGNVVQIRRLRP